MAEKTIPDLPEITTITEFALFPVDSGIETFKMKASNVAQFVSDYILPPGMTVPYAGDTSPTGWLLADGSAVSRSTYARLFAAIGVNHGIGDGSTTFNLPDLRGRTVAGKDNMGGSAANRLTAIGAGVAGTTLGATGGGQNIAVTGTIGGSVNIAHTHGIAHYHQWGYQSAVSTSPIYTLDTGNSATASFTTQDDILLQLAIADTGSGTNVFIPAVVGAATSWYTSGVTSGPSGTGSSAVSGPMSAGGTVSGSSFSWTGATYSVAQPTIVLNYIVKV